MESKWSMTFPPSGRAVIMFISCEGTDHRAIRLLCQPFSTFARAKVTALSARGSTFTSLICRGPFSFSVTCASSRPIRVANSLSCLSERGMAMVPPVSGTAAIPYCSERFSSASVIAGEAAGQPLPLVRSTVMPSLAAVDITVERCSK